MQYRSWLFVPGDSEKKLGRAVSTGADVTVIDLEAGVEPALKPIARRMAAEWLAIHRKHITGGAPMGRWVRINGLESRLWREDLVAVMKGAPDGIFLPHAHGPESVQQLAAELYELEQANHIPTGSTRIIPVVSDNARAALTVSSYLDASLPRLAGFAWTAEGLGAAISATRSRDARGGLTDAFRWVRTQVLLTAHARGLLAIEAPHTDGADEKTFRIAVRDARADGFTGMLACHPAQVGAINTAFTPNEDELAGARAVIAAFEAEKAELGGVDRRGVGQPELNHARRMLGLADGLGGDTRPRTPILRSA